MKFVVKLFPEITIKSQSVRLRFIKILSSSIRNIVRQYDENIAVVRYWDYIDVRVKNEIYAEEVRDALQRIPGIHHILEVEECEYINMHHIFEKTFAYYHSQIENKSFCVRVKRKGKHDFKSQDVERYVGGGLNQQVSSSKVNLTNPDITIHLEIYDQYLRLIKARYEGLKGFPIGTQEDVLSLISGGFDSSVSSYLLMRRGSRVHYCFFNLGGAAHEIGVKQVAYYLWHQFGLSHKVRFISIDFAPIVGEILEKIDNGVMGVVLKRMMMRAASKIAEKYGVQALVTGEALGQVSSQTLTNLRLIDNVTDTLILRPLIAHDKEQIIKIARDIGTEDFAKTMPEFCGVISKKPTVKAITSHVEQQEQLFDFSLLDAAIEQAINIDIRQIAQEAHEQVQQIDVLHELVENGVVIDIRSPEEQENAPLMMNSTDVLLIPFYKLITVFPSLDQSKVYLLYCKRGVMSRLQALVLHEQGYHNVKVYRY